MVEEKFASTGVGTQHLWVGAVRPSVRRAVAVGVGRASGEARERAMPRSGVSIGADAGATLVNATLCYLSRDGVKIQLQPPHNIILSAAGEAALSFSRKLVTFLLSLYMCTFRLTCVARKISSVGFDFEFICLNNVYCLSLEL